MRFDRFKRLWILFTVLISLGVAWPSVRSASSAEVEARAVTLTAEDGGRSPATYYQLSGTAPRIGFIAVHPGVDFRHHFTLHPLAEQGFAGLGMAARNSGTTGTIEEMVLDVAAAVKFVRSQGVKTIVLIGHSGGGSLAAFYEAQAETKPPNRVQHTPAGDPPNLNEFDLPRVDGLVTMNAHEGLGLHTAHHLDPSVTDENDPYSYDGSLDMYSPRNGYHVPPEPTHYSAEFIERFRKGQQEREQRLIEIARGYVQEQNRYRDMTMSPGFAKLDLDTQLLIERAAQYDRPIRVYRTRADLPYIDLSLDPNDRIVGHPVDIAPGKPSRRDDYINWANNDLFSHVTARAFLSTLSTASNARLWDDLARISIPVLVINSSADPGIFPSEAKRTFESVASHDKERVWIIGGNHDFMPEGPKAGKGDQQQQAIGAIAAWAKKRY